MAIDQSNKRMKGLSKSRYTTFCQCEKALWLKVYKPQEETEDPDKLLRLKAGNLVGDLAMGLFGPFVEVTTLNPDGSLDLNTMVNKTQKEMKKGAPIICEASFFHEGNYCAVDILRKTEKGWAIYEVKSVTNLDKDNMDEFSCDMAYQKWLLQQCNVNVTGVFLVYLNKNYTRHNALNLQQLFDIINMEEPVNAEQNKVSIGACRAMQVLSNPLEPMNDLGNHCKHPYKCGFWNYCTRNLPKPTVFDVYGGTITSKKGDRFYFPEKLRLYKEGKMSFADIQDEPLGNIQRLQVDCTLNCTEHIDRDGIRTFLDTLSYPLYFLDFETMQDVVPQYDDTKPYQQIPFQYSLHIQESETSDYQHKEFLAPSDGSDPRRALAEQLCKDIPMNVCSLAFNKKFECERLKELAASYPDLAEHLMNIHQNMRDLLDPFQAGHYYVPAMKGSFSIKSVLPALFPGDPDLDYHNLDQQVQNGNDAMSVFPTIKDMNPMEAQAAREALLHYCELDTWAMVKILEKLYEITK